MRVISNDGIVISNDNTFRVWDVIKAGEGATNNGEICCDLMLIFCVRKAGFKADNNALISQGFKSQFDTKWRKTLGA
jgi:hypothetical protein